MKKIILTLFLISFSVVPVIGLATDPPEVAGCAGLTTRAECLAGFPHEGIIHTCFWNHPTAPHCRHYAPPAPEIAPLAALDTIINVLFTVLVVVAVIFIILGAFSLLTAQGDETKISTGRQKILYAIIAVVVALLARGLVDWVRGLF